MIDVAIVGASVAGAAAAIHLARRGYGVEVLEQGAFPRRKACGEGLFAGGVAELRKLGVLDDVLADSRIISSMRFRLDDVAVEAPMPAMDEPYIGVRREVLDSRLYEAALREGARVRTGVQVRRASREGQRFLLETTQGLVEARVIVAADGVNSRLRHDAGLHLNAPARRFGVSAHLQVAAEPPPRIDVIFGKEQELYLTPVSRDVINVAFLCGQPTSLTFKGNLGTRFLELIGQAGIEGDLIDDPLISGPFPARASRLWRDNLVLTGDAAGFFDPITGEGLSLALRSAVLCADAVAGHLQDDDSAFERYGKQVRAMGRNSIMLARLMLWLSAHPRLGKRAINNLQRQPETLTKLVAINSGSAGIIDLRPRDLRILAFGR